MEGEVEVRPNHLGEGVVEAVEAGVAHQSRPEVVVEAAAVEEEEEEEQPLQNELEVGVGEVELPPNGQEAVVAEEDRHAMGQQVVLEAALESSERGREEELNGRVEGVACQVEGEVVEWRIRSLDCHVLPLGFFSAQEVEVVSSSLLHCCH